MYVNSAGAVVKVGSAEEVPEEYRGTMVALSGGLAGRSSLSVLTPIELQPEEIRRARAKARSADSAAKARSADGAAKAAEAIPGAGPVIVYSTSWCGPCKMAKAYLAEKRIPFEVRDVEKDPKARQEFAAHGGRGVPLLIIKGKPIRGFNAAAIDRALGL
jgi:glutaredoxin